MPVVTTKAQAFPFLDLRAQYRNIKGEIDSAVQRVLESQYFILGPEVTALEKEIAEYSQAQFGIACASGSDALLLALMALEVGPNDEVVTTPFTFVATAGAIARLRARPVFVDIEPSTYNLDPAQLEAAITTRTKAIIPVHLFGMAAEMDAVMKLANAHRVPVIEDAAQAIGARYNGRRVGGIGRCGCFSFFPSKNLGGAGDGGLITTSDAAFADRLQVLHAHGGRTKYEYQLIGMNSRLDALQAAILRVKLRYLDKWSEGRRENARRYEKLFREHGLDRIVGLPQVATKCDHIYNQYVIRCPRRDELKVYLHDCGVPCDVYYPLPLHLQRAFSYLGYKAGNMPESEKASREVLALPIFSELTAQQQELVVRSIASFYRSR